MGRTPRRVITSLLTLGVIASSIGVADAARRSDAGRVRSAIGYLATQQQPNGSIPAFSPIGSTADAVLAIVAAGTGKQQLHAAIGYLRRQALAGHVSIVGLQAKVAAAAVAGGRDPRAFGGINLVKALRSTIDPNGRFGDAAVFDDALAVIALEAADVKIPPLVTQWLLDAQCPDGGWQYDGPALTDEDEHCFSIADPASDFFGSDTNTTSYVVQAIEAAGGAMYPHDPIAFFADIRDAAHGGWGYTWGFQTTDANSTALAIQALISSGEALPSGALAALRALQDPDCGGWSFTWLDDPSGSIPDGPNPGATIGAVLGILRTPLPVEPGPVHGHAPAEPGCG